MESLLGKESSKTIYGSTGFSFGNNSAEQLLDNDWHHVVITIDRFNEGGSTGDMTLYIDSELNGTLTNSNLDFNQKNSLDDGVLYIGGDGVGGVFSGSLDNIRFYNRVLRGEEIDNIYRLEGGE